VPKYEMNLDACRLTGEILDRLRKIVRDELKSAHGAAWETAGLPAEIRELLSQRRAREASMNWSLSESCDLLDYTGFANLFEIIAATPPLFQRFLPLMPDADLLKLRFLELDTVLNRVAYARPVSEADLGFLVGFDDRLKRAPAEAAAPEASPPPAPLPVASPSAVAAPQAAPDDAGVSSGATPPGTPPPAERPPLANEATSLPTVGASAANASAPVAEVTPRELEAALRRGDEKLVLTALYQEVTALADGLWSGRSATFRARAWEHVRESDWYRENFVRLGLRPISDFFGLVEAAMAHAAAGASRDGLQDYLKEHNFVQVLIALRELFRQHTKV
jgi:hypothetical protein